MASIHADKRANEPLALRYAEAMGGLVSILVVVTSVWMAMDASQLGYDKRDIRGLAALGPAGWLICGLLLWIVTFPIYLAKRGELKAAGERRRQWLLAHGANPYGAIGPTVGPLPPAPPPVGVPAGWYGHAPRQGAPAATATVMPAPTTSAPASPDFAAELIRLGQLRDAGIVSEHEFQQRKHQLLSHL